MQENNFEKQVQQKMDELRFDPSAPVWQKVEAQIRRKKKRRRVIFLLLPLLLTGGGLVWYFSGWQGEKSLQNVTTVQQDKTGLKQNGEDADTAVSNTKPNALQEVEEEKNTTIINNSTIRKNQTNGQRFQKENETFLKMQNNAPEQKKATPSEPLIVKEKSENRIQESNDAVLQNKREQKQQPITDITITEQKNVSKAFLDSAVILLTTTAPLVIVEKSVTETIITLDSTINPATTAVTINTKNDSTGTNVAVAAPVETSKNKQARNWEWTASGRIGVSGARTEMMDVFNVESAADFYASPAMGNTSSPAFNSTSTVTNSTAFSLGAGVRKKMFKNAFVSTGIQYSQYRTQSMVGTRKTVDTTVFYNGRANALESYFAQSGSQSRYTTRFHYIEIPLAFEYRLFRNVPLQMQLGLSAGYLFATNALYYDRTARVFYENDEWLRKMSFNVFTTLDYRLWRAEKFSLFAGPQVQWGLTPMQQKSEDKKHHQFFAGLQTRITF